MRTAHCSRPSTPARSAFACCRFPPDVIVVAVRWHYVYRAIDQFGQVIDVFVSARRDAKAARRFVELALAV